MGICRWSYPMTSQFMMAPNINHVFRYEVPIAHSATQICCVSCSARSNTPPDHQSCYCAGLYCSTVSSKKFAYLQAQVFWRLKLLQEDGSSLCTDIVGQAARRSIVQRTTSAKRGMTAYCLITLIHFKIFLCPSSVFNLPSTASWELWRRTKTTAKALALDCISTKATSLLLSYSNKSPSKELKSEDKLMVKNKDQLWYCKCVQYQWYNISKTQKSRATNLRPDLT